MRILFMGTAEFGRPCLDVIRAEPADELVGVVTQPPRPKGRRRQPAPSPIHAHVEPSAAPVLTPEKVNAAASVQAIRDLAPDLIVVVAYGQILRPAILEIPARECVNVHGSLLPKYRGAAPIQWAVAQGERQTGVTTLYMDAGMDSGDIILQGTLAIDPDETAGALHDRLAELGARLLRETLAAIRDGSVKRRPQNPDEATFAPILKKADARIDWAMPAETLRNRIRGFNPWPGSICAVPSQGGRTLKILQAAVEPGAGPPGTVQDLGADGPLIQTGDGRLRLTLVQPEGKKPMAGAAFMRGHPMAVGDVLE
ncbi:MAG: methionyl-tRNA formyltransferase [Kiritimatiellae bacterium]|nr:methionyl-tRNA formyltransferase [Kiritimatiellia bacterium]